jgi:hypothetical protein
VLWIELYDEAKGLRLEDGRSPVDLIAAPASVKQECARRGLSCAGFTTLLDVFQCLVRGMQAETSVVPPADGSSQAAPGIIVAALASGSAPGPVSPRSPLATPPARGAEYVGGCAPCEVSRGSEVSTVATGSMSRSHCAAAAAAAAEVVHTTPSGAGFAQVAGVQQGQTHLHGGAVRAMGERTEVRGCADADLEASRQHESDPSSSSADGGGDDVDDDDDDDAKGDKEMGLEEQGQFLLLLAHVMRCRSSTTCSRPGCAAVKALAMRHTRTCRAGNACRVPRCALAKRLMFHHRVCRSLPCAICMPLRREIASAKGLRLPEVRAEVPSETDEIMTDKAEPSSGLPPAEGPHRVPSASVDCDEALGGAESKLTHELACRKRPHADISGRAETRNTSPRTLA